MNIGLCASIDAAAAAARAGFDYLEENVQSFLAPEQPGEIFAANLAAAQAAPLPIRAAACFLPGALKCTGPETDLDRIERYGASAFRRAREAGIAHIVYGSGGARQVPDGFDHARARGQFLEGLRRIAPFAQAEGVTIVIEPLNRNECNFINTLAEGAGVVADIAHPAVRLLADIYHMSVNGEKPEEIVAHGKWIRHVHVAETEGRQAPGTARQDFSPWLRALGEIGYAGAISYECAWKPETLPDSLAGFRALCERWIGNQAKP